MQVFRYNEPMNEHELGFLQKKEEKERTQFTKLVRIVMIVSFVVPFIVAWLRATNNDHDPFSYGTYFSGVGLLMGIGALILFPAYSRTLGILQRDIRKGTKTVELTHVTRKQYMQQNNTYHFYLNSPNKLSIEVSEIDYHSLGEGDELNIEYTTYSKMYLGYF